MNFSGYIYIDKYGKYYIGPQDLSTSAPFLRGLRLGELGDVIYQSPNKVPEVIIILDSCYAGIIPKNTSIFYENEQFQKDIGSRSKSKIVLLSYKNNMLSNGLDSTRRGEPCNHGVISRHFIQNIKNSGKPTDTFDIVKQISDDSTLNCIVYTNTISKNSKYS